MNIEDSDDFVRDEQNGLKKMLPVLKLLCQMKVQMI